MSDLRAQRIVTIVAQQAATERQRKTHDLSRPWFIVLFAAFVVIDLAAITLGINAYSDVATQQAAAEQQQLALGPIVSTIRANDADGAIARGEGPEGSSLVFIQTLDSGSYETRIYLYQGSIVEEYALAGAAYTPEKATVLSSSKSFDFDYDDGLLTLSTDAGEAHVALRSAKDVS